MKLEAVLKGNWDLVVLVVCGAVTLVLHQLEVIPDSYVPKLVLLGLCVFVLHEIIERAKSKEEHEILERIQNESIESIREILTKGVEAKVLDDRPEFYKVMIERVKEVKNTLDITNFTPQPPTTTGIPERLEYFDTVASVVKNRKNVEMRRIVSITTKDKCKWVEKEQLRGFEGQSNFHLGYYDFAPKHMPLYTIVLLDKNEIFLGVYWEPIHLGHRDKNIWIKSKELCEAFADYYEVLWNNAIKLKEGPFMNWEEFERIRRGFEGERRL
jgi:hypothetical protein